MAAARVKGFDHKTLDKPRQSVFQSAGGQGFDSPPFGVLGEGEVVCIPPPTAIANAIYDAIGVRVTRMPMNPKTLLEALKRKEG